MATVVKLGNRPKSFKKTVEFEMLTGETGCIECVFKYRTRTELGELVDKIAADSGSALEAGDFIMQRLAQASCAANAGYLIEVLDGWNLDQPLGLDSAMRLADELPAAVVAIMEGYRAAIHEGRLKN